MSAPRIQPSASTDEPQSSMAAEKSVTDVNPKKVKMLWLNNMVTHGVVSGSDGLSATYSITIFTGDLLDNKIGLPEINIGRCSHPESTANLQNINVNFLDLTSLKFKGKDYSLFGSASYPDFYTLFHEVLQKQFPGYFFPKYNRQVIAIYPKDREVNLEEILESFAKNLISAGYSFQREALTTRNDNHFPLRLYNTTEREALVNWLGQQPGYTLNAADNFAQVDKAKHDSNLCSQTLFNMMALHSNRNILRVSVKLSPAAASAPKDVAGTSSGPSFRNS